MPQALVDFPGHARHGRRVDLVEVAAVELMPGWVREVTFVRWPGQAEPIGFPRARLAGTAENVALRREETAGDGAQGELLL